MNYSKEEKITIISQLIQLAKSDDKVKAMELTFIKAIAKSLKITDEEVDELTAKPVEEIILKPESERILQFHRLILVMNVDQHTSVEEIDMIRQFGLKMGLPPTAIDTVFRMMENYEHKVIPPQELIKVFKNYYN